MIPNTSILIYFGVLMVGPGDPGLTTPLQPPLGTPGGWGVGRPEFVCPSRRLSCRSPLIPAAL